MVKQLNHVTQAQAEKMLFVPEPHVDIYEWQEDVLRIQQVTDIKKFHARKRRFLDSPAGKTFLQYKRKKIATLQGLDIWLVDGDALRSGQKAGDVDFTMGGHAYRYLYVPVHEIWIDDAIAKKPRDLWPTIWHEYAERTMMRNGMNYVDAHTFFGSRIEIIQREGSYFLLPVGTHRQNHPYTCGPAAAKIVMDYLRYPVSESYLARLCKASARKGVNPEDIVVTARRMGFFAQEKRHMSANAVKRFVRKGIPVIVNYQYTPEYGEGHYAVIIGFSKTHFILSDPASDHGYEQVAIKEFMKQWYELEDVTVRQGIMISNCKF